MNCQLIKVHVLFENVDGCYYLSFILRLCFLNALVRGFGNLLFQNSSTYCPVMLLCFFRKSRVCLSLHFLFQGHSGKERSRLFKGLRQVGWLRPDTLAGNAFGVHFNSRQAAAQVDGAGIYSLPPLFICLWCVDVCCLHVGDSASRHQAFPSKKL